MTFSRGEIVFAPFKFSEIDVYRLRPVLVISQPDHYEATGGFVAAMITAARRSTWPFDVAIEHWEAAGLSLPCLVRLKLFTIANSEVRESVGHLDEPTMRMVGNNLATLLT